MRKGDYSRERNGVFKTKSHQVNVNNWTKSSNGIEEWPEMKSEILGTNKADPS